MNSSDLALKQLSRHLACCQCELAEINDSCLIGGISDGLLELDYYVDVDDELYDEILETLALPEFAPLLASLRLFAPDWGINGTRSWNLDGLAIAQSTFENLKILEIEGTKPQHHNRTILGSYEENGIVARLLDKMPNLECLSIPSAPSPAFFQRHFHPLKHLTLQSGYDTQNFILNLAQSNCFSQLQSLDFTDYAETYIQDYEQYKTPRQHYVELFNSETLPRLEVVILRQSLLNVEETEELRQTRLGRQLDLLKIAE